MTWMQDVAIGALLLILGTAAGWSLRGPGEQGFVGPPQLLNAPAPPEVHVIVRTVRGPKGEVDCVGDATAIEQPVGHAGWSASPPARPDYGVGLQWPIGIGGWSAWRDAQLDGSWRLGGSNWHVTGHATPGGGLGLGIRRDF